MQGKKHCDDVRARREERSRKRTGRLKAMGMKMGRSGQRDTCRRLKGKNELSGICHDFTRLCNDKVMNVNDGCLFDVQDASPGHI